LLLLLQAFNLVSYLNAAGSLDKAERVMKDIRWEWALYSDEYNTGRPVGSRIDVMAAWDEWFLDLMATRVQGIRDFIEGWATELQAKYELDTDVTAMNAVAMGEYYYNMASMLAYNDAGYPTGSPPPPDTY
jgi:hypothetical protein